jgi:hypothetical protein
VRPHTLHSKWQQAAGRFHRRHASRCVHPRVHLTCSHPPSVLTTARSSYGAHPCMCDDEGRPYCRYYQIHVNKGKAVTLPDGRIRIIVASVNPGIARTNWVDTAGHDFGTCCFRWITPYPSSPTMSEREETSMADGGVHQPSCRLFETQEALTKHLLDNKAI